MVEFFVNISIGILGLVAITFFLRLFLTNDDPVKDKKYYTDLYKSEIEKLEHDGKLRCTDSKQLEETEFIQIVRTVDDPDQALKLYVLIKKMGQLFKNKKKYETSLFLNKV